MQQTIRRSLGVCTWRQSLLRNKIEGVTKGFLVYLRISGIGYRAAIDGQTITFKLGYSHDVAYDLPSSMRAFLPEPTLIGLYGIDKNQVTLLLTPVPSKHLGLGQQMCREAPIPHSSAIPKSNGDVCAVIVFSLQFDVDEL